MSIKRYLANLAAAMTASASVFVLAQPATGRSQTAAPAAEQSSQRRQAAPSAAGRTDNRWRYRFHNDHWWYWLPINRWAYWTGAKWQDYEPKTYAQWHLHQLEAKYQAELARFESLQANQPADAYSYYYYVSPYRIDYGYYTPLFGGYRSGGVLGLGAPSSFQQGDLNLATSVGGYMGGALRGPAGY